MALEVKRLSKYFGGVQAVCDVSFRVGLGECVALIGPNGAGKSTTFACIAGQQVPTHGSVVWWGHSLNAMNPAQRLRLGVARTFQVAQTFEALTVLQNVQLALQGSGLHRPWDVLARYARARATQILSQVALQDCAHQLALTLPYGAKKRLELALALAGIDDIRRAGGDALLLLDEPAAGLSAVERADLMRLIQSLASGMAVLYTEHNMDAVFGVADRVIVLIDGEIAADGAPHEVARNPLVRSRYLGTSADAAPFESPNRA